MDKELINYLENNKNFLLKSKKVYVKKIKLLKSNQRKTTTFEVECSKGFYIRSFARDLGYFSWYFWTYLFFKKNKSWSFFIKICDFTGRFVKNKTNAHRI